MKFLFSNDLPTLQSLNRTYLLTSVHPRATAAFFHFQSQITRHELYCHLSADMFNAQGPDMIQGLVFTCNGHKMDLCSPALKVMYSCDSVWKQILEVYCFTLSAQVFLYKLLGWGKRGQIKDHVYCERLFTYLGATESHGMKNTVKFIIIKVFPIFPEGQTNLPGRRTIYKCSWEGKVSDDILILMEESTAGQISAWKNIGPHAG